MNGNREQRFLVKSFAMPWGHFKTGTVISNSGIYRVHHSAHRLPHEVTLLKGEKFPRCQKCQDAVTFKLVRAFNCKTVMTEFSWRIALYELPVFDDDAASAKTG